MKSIEEGLQPVVDYLLSIKRNTVNGWYELEVGVPADWIYKGNELIDCETLNKTKVGHLLKISPKIEDVIVDDLIEFLNLIIETNSKIAAKEMEFTSTMDKVKHDLEEQAKKFYKELDDLREKSFSKFDVKKSVKPMLLSSEVQKECEISSEPPKRKRGRPPKVKENEQEKTD